MSDCCNKMEDAVHLGLMDGDGRVCSDDFTALGVSQFKFCPWCGKAVI